MPRTRTTPEVVATAHYDTVDAFILQIAYNDDLTPNVGKTVFRYVIKGRDSSGREVSVTEEDIQWNALPAAVRTSLKSIHAKILQDAENKGYVGAGVDENDL